MSVANVGDFEILPTPEQISVQLDEGAPPERMACSMTSTTLNMEQFKAVVGQLKKTP